MIFTCINTSLFEANLFNFKDFGLSGCNNTFMHCIDPQHKVFFNITNILIRFERKIVISHHHLCTEKHALNRDGGTSATL